MLAAAMAVGVVARPAVAQARAPLPVAVDTSGVLSAIRVIDLRQLCRCPTVKLDSIVRRGTRLSMFEVLNGARAFVFSAADVALLKLAHHRVIRTALPNMTSPARDSVAVAVQLFKAAGADRRILVVATPPNGVTAAWLVSLTPHRSAWRTTSIRSVYEP